MSTIKAVASLRTALAAAEERAEKAEAERDAYAARWRDVTKACDAATRDRDEARADAAAANKVIERARDALGLKPGEGLTRTIRALVESGASLSRAGEARPTASDEELARAWLREECKNWPGVCRHACDFCLPSLLALLSRVRASASLAREVRDVVEAVQAYRELTDRYTELAKTTAAPMPIGEVIANAHGAWAKVADALDALAAAERNGKEMG